MNIKEVTLWSFLTQRKATRGIVCPDDLRISIEEFANELKARLKADQVVQKLFVDRHAQAQQWAEEQKSTKKPPQFLIERSTLSACCAAEKQLAQEFKQREAALF